MEVAKPYGVAVVLENDMAALHASEIRQIPTETLLRQHDHPLLSMLGERPLYPRSCDSPGHSAGRGWHNRWAGQDPEA